MKQADLDRNEIIDRDEVLKMARQAWVDSGEGWVAYDWFSDRVNTLEAFAKLVAAKEREWWKEHIKKDIDTAKKEEREWWKEHIKKDIDTAKKEEREACAELVEMNAEKCKKDMMPKMLLLSNADAIRARGEA